MDDETYTAPNASWDGYENGNEVDEGPGSRVRGFAGLSEDIFFSPFIVPTFPILKLTV